MIERWAPEAEDTLRQLWNVESMTASECAKVLGVTRNAVIGKVHRMKLSRRPNPLLKKLAADKRAQNRRETQQRYRQSHPQPPKVRNAKSNLPRVSSARVVRKPVVVATPERNVNDTALIASWLEQNGGARRFERSATGDPPMMALWLCARGYQVTLSITKAKPIRVTDPSGKLHNMSLRRLQELVDSVRAAEGLEPVLVEAA